MALEIFFIDIVLYNIVLNQITISKKDIIHALSMAIIALIISQFISENNIVEPLLSLSLLVSLILRYYKKFGVVNTIATATITLLIITFAATLTSVTFNQIINTSHSNNIRNSALNYLILSGFFIIYGLALAFTSHWLKKYISTYFIKQNFKKFPLIIIGIFMLIALVFYWLTFNLASDKLNVSEFITYAMAFTIILITLAMVIYARYQISKIELKSEKKRRESNNIYIKEIEKNQKLLRRYKHDYHNVSLGLLGYLENNDLEGAKSYYNEYYKAFEEDIFKDDSRLDKLYLFNQSELKSLLWVKCIEALKKNIKLNVEVNEKITFNGNIKDLMLIVGIWFDNAIEATQSGDTIAIATYTLNDAQYFVIENPINTAISLKDVTTSGFTTKDGEHGIGLDNVRRIIDKNTLFDTNTEITPKSFRQILIIGGE